MTAVVIILLIVVVIIQPPFTISLLRGRHFVSIISFNFLDTRYKPASRGLAGLNNLTDNTKLPSDGGGIWTGRGGEGHAITTTFLLVLIAFGELGFYLEYPTPRLLTNQETEAGPFSQFFRITETASIPTRHIANALSLWWHVNHLTRPGSFRDSVCVSEGMSTVAIAPEKSPPHQIKMVRVCRCWYFSLLCSAYWLTSAIMLSRCSYVNERALFVFRHPRCCAPKWAAWLRIL